jgi:lysozyme family protein
VTTQEMLAYIIDTYEGGEIFTDKPFDRGGATKFGITLRTLQYYRRKKTGNGALAVTVNDVKNLDRGEALDCAYVVFAGESKIALIPDEGVRYAVLDYGFHSGFQTAIEALQHAVYANADGLIGDQTLAALAQYHHEGTILSICTQRAELLQRLILKDPTQRGNLFGWWTRVTAVQRKAVIL